ncbi:MAG: hypothetical protein DRG24_02375 [Epsilonproteobacteria bacterium]|nr:MAG: hypothetical protein DRG24_02375 [Campylobacterota bacterium]
MKTVHKFLLLGLTTTAIDYIVYSIAIVLGVDYVIAIVLGYSLGLLANYLIGRRYIFTSGAKLKSSKHEFIAVVSIAIFGALFNIVIVKILSYSLFTLDPLYSRIIAIGVVFFWNYFARKVFVYH